jgi:hypothetical protein
MTFSCAWNSELAAQAGLALFAAAIVAALQTAGEIRPETANSAPAAGRSAQPSRYY